MPSVLIANRGEIACRVIRACKKLGWRAIAVYSDADRGALHCELADEAHYIGAAKSAESYLNIGRVVLAAQQSGADFAHPGYGFLAENADFARAIMDAGVGWVGPSPQAIVEMGDKNSARELAAAAGVPVLPGTGGLAGAGAEELLARADEVGYPLLVKAAGGGGGIGMKVVESAAGLVATAAATCALSERAFGNGEFFFERYVRVARHIEVQVFGFGDGAATHFFERECSVQRRFQKIVEETPAPGIPARILAEMAESAAELARRQNYEGAGTVEFIYDDERERYYFLEMNTRIQVEHPITEEVVGVDLVAMQLLQAAGELAQSAPARAESGQPQISAAAYTSHYATAGEDARQSAPEKAQSGHAIECRLYAENPAKNFLPSPGRLSQLAFPPEGDGTRIECGFRGGDRVTPYYDPMIAKIIARADDRASAIAKMAAILDAVVVEGISTNLSFLRRCIAHPDFARGGVPTDFVEKNLAALR